VNYAKAKAACNDVAENVEIMMECLCSRGFTRKEAVQMITGMLSSSVVYTPFAGVVADSDGSAVH